MFLISCSSKDSQEIFLTSEEQLWLDSHQGQIRIGYTTDYPPVEFLQNGTYVGISADYFHLLEEKLNTSIEMIQFDHWDGMGYPNQRKGQEIPLNARILNIIDAYVVMTSGRPYKPAISKSEAIEGISPLRDIPFYFKNQYP